MYTSRCSVTELEIPMVVGDIVLGQKRAEKSAAGKMIEKLASMAADEGVGGLLRQQATALTDDIAMLIEKHRSAAKEVTAGGEDPQRILYRLLEKESGGRPAYEVEPCNAPGERPLFQARVTLWAGYSVAGSVEPSLKAAQRSAAEAALAEWAPASGGGEAAAEGGTVALREACVPQLPGLVLRTSCY